MKASERLFLLDGMALAYRAYFSFISRPLINSKGQNTGAVYGFVLALLKILDEHPEHVAVVFDTKEPTFRHVRYPEYKATRDKMPEDMASQLEILKDVVRAFRTPVIEFPGYEADDIIGTLARRAEREGVRTFMVTGDKDFMQLISPMICMYRPGRSGSDMEIVDEGGVRAKFGVEPERVIEVLGLTGDTSDNVPGVPGIGEKTAIPLIQKFGSIEELYRRLEEVPQKGVREKLRAHRDLAFLSRDLVTIDTRVPLELDFHILRASEPDRPALLRLFTSLEFKTLAERIPGPPPPPTRGESERPPHVETSISSDDHVYRCILSASELRTLTGRWKDARLLVVDTETTSKDPLAADLVGIAVCDQEKEAYYIPVRAPGGLINTTDQALPKETVLELLKPVLENPRVPKAGQNIKYDMLVLRSHGVHLQGVAHDTMVASYILRPEGQHNLDALAQEAFGYRMISYEDLTGRGKNQKSLTEVPLASVADYSAEDADWTMRILAWQQPRLRDLGVERLCQDVEFPLMEVLAEMEFTGIALDTEYLGGMSKELERLLDGLVSEIHRHAGGSFNINSTQQLGEVLFGKLGLPTVRKTKTGYSTDVAVLETLRHQHPIVEKLLEYRQLTKLKSTYVDALPSLVNPRTGRLHTSFNQTVAATGRLSSSDPNLQNIPIRTEIGRAIRRAFVPAATGSILLSADYSQIELRVMAHISGDEGLQAAFRNGEDIHATTAAKVFGVTGADVTRDMRRKAKEVNFGIMYGIGAFGLANRLEISQPEARDIITRYFERFPRVKQYIQDTIETAKRTGHVTTMLGRRRYLPDVNSRNQVVRSNAERQAINMPIQGTAADMIKLAMIRIHRVIRDRGLRSRMLLQVHDELVFEAPREERATLEPLVIEHMQNALPLTVPIQVEVGSGLNWLEAH
jgi:DNA polymerase-1